jgi:hypothetical protein
VSSESVGCAVETQYDNHATSYLTFRQKRKKVKLAALLYRARWAENPQPPSLEFIAFAGVIVSCSPLFAHYQAHL